MEKSKISRFRNFIDKFTMLGVSDPNDVESMRRSLLLKLIIITGILVFVLMGFLAFSEGNMSLAVVDLASASALVAIILVFFATKRLTLCAFSGITMVGLFFIHLYITGGSNDTGYLWYYTFPLFTHFLLGDKKGAIVSLGLIIFTYIISIANVPFLPVVDRGPSFLYRFIASYFLVTAFSYFFEHLRHRAQHMLLARSAEADDARIEAVRASAAKTEFLAKVSHELRTPLNHIIGFTDLLKNPRNGDLNKKQAEYLNDVSDSGRHLLNLINDVLDLSQVESGRIELSINRISVEMLIDKCISAHRDVALRGGISLTAASGAPGAEVFADETRLTQVLYNILTNAIKHTGDGGAIEIRTNFHSDENGGFVEIAVTDNGDGIAAANLARIFELFERAETMPDKSIEGVGIGLALCRNLVTMHGGKVWAESPGKGLGSTFRVLLPRA